MNFIHFPQNNIYRLYSIDMDRDKIFAAAHAFCIRLTFSPD